MAHDFAVRGRNEVAVAIAGPSVKRKFRRKLAEKFGCGCRNPVRIVSIKIRTKLRKRRNQSSIEFERLNRHRMALRDFTAGARSAPRK
jgi:hypothetical protein